jgi:predicted dehydrogenase
MNDKTSVQTTRRQFLAAAAAAAAVPTIVPSSVLGQNAPSKQITMGCIGVKSQGNGDMRSFMGLANCRVLAVCDVDSDVLAQRTKQVNDRYGNSDCKPYDDYREVVARKDIDTVMIATPDHWHAAIAIEAARSGKDIFCEKPVTHTFAEGVMLVNEVHKHNRIWQTGSWQRSVWNFRQAVAIVRNGLIGELQHVEIGLPTGHAYPPPPKPETPPSNLDYDMWIGPSQMMPYMKDRLHFNWRWNYNTGGGQLMDWIGHHNDIAHWGMGEDLGGPTLVEAGDFVTPQEKDVWDAAWQYEVKCTYASGVTTRISNNNRMGVTFFGSEGWVYVKRGGFAASNPEWTKRGFNPGSVEVYESNNHEKNFLDCVISRKPTITPVEVSHRSVTPGHIALAMVAVGRRIKVRWDPKTQQTTNEQVMKLLRQEGDEIPWKPWRKKWAGPLLT